MPIPWTALLANAPALAESARRLIAATRRSGAPASPDPASLAARVDALEQRDRETADLAAQMAAQIAALTTATQALQSRARTLTLVAAIGALLAVAAILVVAVF
jgi:hypothetical protein